MKQEKYEIKALVSLRGLYQKVVTISDHIHSGLDGSELSTGRNPTSDDQLMFFENIRFSSAVAAVYFAASVNTSIRNAVLNVHDRREDGKFVVTSLPSGKVQVAYTRL